MNLGEKKYIKKKERKRKGKIVGNKCMIDNLFDKCIINLDRKINFENEEQMSLHSSMQL